jgi:hypothetical protein
MPEIGLKITSACSGEVETGSPTRTCVTQESKVISDRFLEQQRFNSIGNGFRASKEDCQR